VIISVPVKILQDKELIFVPKLPQEKQDAIANIPIWEGFKAFFEFNENFYGDGYEYAIRPETDGQKIYYNASLGQNTKKNILGLFAVGKPAREFLSFSDKDLKASILNDLDKLFNKRATPTYVKHLSQNWNVEPFIKSGYISDYADWRAVKALGKSVAVKVYFAGGEYTDGEDWVSVHIAAQSAKVAVTELLK
jgi:monoamine oxidase